MPKTPDTSTRFKALLVWVYMLVFLFSLFFQAGNGHYEKLSPIKSRTYSTILSPSNDTAALPAERIDYTHYLQQASGGDGKSFRSCIIAATSDWTRLQSHNWFFRAIQALPNSIGWYPSIPIAFRKILI